MLSVLYTDSTLKKETINGESLYTFKPNTITYGIPVDHSIGKAAGNAKIGVVFHTSYVGDRLSSLQARAGANIKSFNPMTEVVVINNDTPMHKVGLNHQEEVKFDKHVSDIEAMCKKCGDFLDELVTNTGKTGDEKWHVASYLKPFFNAEIKAARTINLSLIHI